MPGAKFLLGHGATFFCPHTYDVKLIANFEDNKQQTTLCQHFFNSLQSGESIKYALRPTLAINGLPATGQGYSREWTSPVLYHVWNFGNDSDAGPGNGWNTTTIINDNITVNNFNVSYFREFEISPGFTQLSYLLHAHEDGVTSNVRYVLTHYVSNAPNFEQILYVNITSNTDKIRKNGYAMFIDIPGYKDTFDQRLTAGSIVKANLYSVDENYNEVQYTLSLEVTHEYYAGVDDGFADFKYYCYFAPPHPQSRSLCI
eukprot:TRINITY_DN2558_c0_g1_i1.p1 TRINITY_DN2558_c0_g1~~TRINITY_DN2558_c0_g1_i1.p1  ORF type:complete len:258 (+),score=70.19 TRINITY_DN2558_c0_g1_i1:252-1025(+)